MITDIRSFGINLFRDSYQKTKTVITKSDILTNPDEHILSLWNFFHSQELNVPPIETFMFAIYENEIKYRKYSTIFTFIGVL